MPRTTVAEALASMAQYNIGLRRYGSLQYQLFYREDKNNVHSRLIDELEDCVEVAHDMRTVRNREQSGDVTWTQCS